MGLVRTQRVGEGMHFSGRGKSIDVHIEDIKGPRDNRWVKFKIQGVEGMNYLSVTKYDGLVDLVDEIKIAVCPNVENAGHAAILYRAPWDYQLDRMEFED